MTWRPLGSPLHVSGPRVYVRVLRGGGVLWLPLQPRGGLERVCVFCVAVVCCGCLCSRAARH
jgi:hypothetical protein